jgi:hypothetical protein
VQSGVRWEVVSGGLEGGGSKFMTHLLLSGFISALSVVRDTAAEDLWRSSDLLD